MNNIENIIRASNKSLEDMKNIPEDFNLRLLSNLEIRNRIIIGPRGTGKTTYLLSVAKKYKNEEVLYIDIDSAMLVNFDFRTNNNSLKEFKKTLIEILDGMKPKVVIFDEVQNLFEWNIYLKQLIDTFKSILFLASGSDARSLMRTQEYGTRRYEIFLCGFYTFKEYIKRFPKGNLEDYISHWNLGGRDKITDTQIFQSIFEKQMSLTRLKDFSIKSVLKFISFNPGTSLNTNAIANKIEEESMKRPDDTQIKNILKFLEESGLIYKVQDIYTSDRLRKKTEYKLYSADWLAFKYFNGLEYGKLSEETIPRKGLVFENMIISNIFSSMNTLLERERIKTLVPKPDVDIIINDKKYEFKSFDALDPGHKEYKNIIDKSLKTKAIIVHAGKTENHKINQIQTIKYINVEEFLLKL